MLLSLVVVVGLFTGCWALDAAIQKDQERKALEKQVTKTFWVIPTSQRTPAFEAIIENEQIQGVLLACNETQIEYEAVLSDNYDKPLGTFESYNGNFYETGLVDVFQREGTEVQVVSVKEINNKKTEIILLKDAEVTITVNFLNTRAYINGRSDSDGRLLFSGDIQQQIENNIFDKILRLSSVDAVDPAIEEIKENSRISVSGYIMPFFLNHDGILFDITANDFFTERVADIKNQIAIRQEQATLERAEQEKQDAERLQAVMAMNEQVAKVVKLNGTYVTTVPNVRTTGWHAIRFFKDENDGIIRARIILNGGYGLTYGQFDCSIEDSKLMIGGENNLFTILNNGNLQVSSDQIYVFTPFLGISGKTFTRVSGNGNRAYGFRADSHYVVQANDGSIYDGGLGDTMERTYDYNNGFIILMGKLKNQEGEPRAIAPLLEFGPYLWGRDGIWQVEN